MSMLGIALMNELSFGFLNFTPADILTKLREMIIGVLHQTNEKFEQSDGLDMALCFYDKKKSLLEYSGANIPVFVFANDNNETAVKILKPNKIPVGVYPIRKNFTNENIKLQKNDVIYLCSDGYQDQFGGEHNEKFMSKRLKQLFIDCHNDTMINQYNILDVNLEKWMNADAEKKYKPQTDDILILGLKV